MRAPLLFHLLLIAAVAAGCAQPPAGAPPESGSAERQSAEPGAPEPAAPAELCDGEPCIQVGTFNAYWLGARRRYERPLRRPREVERMTELIADRLDLEVVVLQEVNVEEREWDDGGLLFTPEPYGWLRSTLGERGYRLAEGRSGNAQRLVIAYDADEVELLEDAFELAVRDAFEFSPECRSAGLRRALAARFRAGQLDFWAVGVHLKSKRGGECSERIRSAQAAELARELERLVERSGEPDVLLLGDFNAGAGESSLAPLREAGFVALTDAGRRAPESAGISYLIPPYESLIDHLMIRPGPTAEWIAGSTRVFDPHTFEGDDEERSRRRYLELISDHAPVWASFRTARDDD